MRPLGKQQTYWLLFLAAGSTRFHPTRTGEPWDVLKSLIRRNLVWANRGDIEYWNPATGQWDFSRREWQAGLTTDGVMVVEDLTGKKQ